MTANEHYRKAVELFREYEEKLEPLMGQLFESDQALALQAGLTRILKAAEVQMMMANYKAGT